MNASELIKLVKDSSNESFFANLENFLGFKIPTNLQNILTINCYNSAIAISKFDESAISEMQEFMVNDFAQLNLPNEERKEDYLGVYVTIPNKFRFLSGEMRLLRAMIERCHRLFEENTLNQSTSTDASALNDRSYSSFTITQKPDEGNYENIHGEAIFKTIRNWMMEQKCFNEISETNLNFRPISNFQTKGDGSLSCSVYCPFELYGEKFGALYKAYPSYYKKRKRDSASTSNPILKPPRWYLLTLEKHLLKIHAIRSSTNALSSDEEYSDTGRALDKQYADESDFVLSDIDEMDQKEELPNIEDPEVQPITKPELTPPVITSLDPTTTTASNAIPADSATLSKIKMKKVRTATMNVVRITRSKR